MSESESIAKTSQLELDAVASLIAREDGNRNISSAYLRWWYFQNPSRSFSIFHVRKGETIEGMATTNNFSMKLEDRQVCVAMPQKVLTSEKVRGKGYFGRLYRHTESDNIAQGVDCFLTFTNAMSTPIFLKRFGYRRGISPSIFVVPSLFAIFKKASYRLVNQFDETYLSRSDLIHPGNSVKKDMEYFNWRYFGYKANRFAVLNFVGGNRENEGYVVLKRKTVMHIPLYVVMDIITHNPANAVRLLGEALKYAARNLVLGIMVLENNIFPSSLPFAFCMTWSGKLNFLVKGRTEDQTSTLASVRFNWFGGDLDFF